MPRPVRDFHASGLHNAPYSKWCELLADVTNHTHIGAATEHPPRNAPDGWRCYRPVGVKGAECGIYWNTNRYELAGPPSDCRGYRRLTSRVFYTGKGDAKNGVTATWALLHDTADNYDHLRIAAHFPASVQDGKRFSRKVRRVIAWRSSLRGLRRLVRELDAELRPAEITGSFDFNVDLRSRVWRAVINHGLRGTGLRVKAPTSGTHHHRAIDAHATTLRRHPSGTGVRVLPKVHPFDHRPIVGTFARRHR